MNVVLTVVVEQNRQEGYHGGQDLLRPENSGQIKVDAVVPMPGTMGHTRCNERH